MLKGVSLTFFGFWFLFFVFCFFLFRERLDDRSRKGTTMIHYRTLIFLVDMHFPGGLEVKVSASMVGDPGMIPGSGRSPGEGNGNPLQYSCLENPTDGEAW